MPSISSSVTTTPGTATNVRRRDSMGEAGVLGIGTDAVDWRATRRAGDSATSRMATGGRGVLQLLAPSQSKVVPILGQVSGWDVTRNKRGECASQGNDWVTIAGSDKASTFEVLPNCATYIEVQLRRLTDGGDHDVAICEVSGTGVWDASKDDVLWRSEGDDWTHQSALDSSSALYSGQLRKEGII